MDLGATIRILFFLGRSLPRNTRLWENGHQHQHKYMNVLNLIRPSSGISYKCIIYICCRSVFDFLHGSRCSCLTHICTRACTHPRTHTNAHTYTHTHARTHTRTHTTALALCSLSHTHTCTHTHLHTHIHTHAHTQIHVHTNTHTQHILSLSLTHLHTLTHALYRADILSG